MKKVTDIGRLYFEFENEVFNTIDEKCNAIWLCASWIKRNVPASIQNRFYYYRIDIIRLKAKLLSAKEVSEKYGIDEKEALRQAELAQY